VDAFDLLAEHSLAFDLDAPEAILPELAAVEVALLIERPMLFCEQQLLHCSRGVRFERPHEIRPILSLVELHNHVYVMRHHDEAIRGSPGDLALTGQVVGHRVPHLIAPKSVDPFGFAQGRLRRGRSW
jgi:hypothetical protein